MCLYLYWQTCVSHNWTSAHTVTCHREKYPPLHHEMLRLDPTAPGASSSLSRSTVDHSYNSRCEWGVLSCHPGSAEASQVQREVPEQTPECATGGSWQTGPVSPSKWIQSLHVVLVSVVSSQCPASLFRSLETLIGSYFTHLYPASFISYCKCFII